MPETDSLVPGLGGAEYVALAGELYGMPQREARRRAHEVLTYLDLEDARYRKLEEYSTGMKQRLKLAQALVHDPPLLLLDEPTSGLDPAGREGLLKLLLSLGKDHGKSLILSTHLLGDVEQNIIGSFRNGGGVPYSAYPRFHTLMAEASAQSYDAALIDAILPLVPGLTEKLQTGIAVAEIGCGSGHAINLMARAFANSRFTGYDFSEGLGAMWGEQRARAMLADAGFSLQDIKQVSGDPFNNYYIASRP